MSQFIIPQFLDVEPRVIGPITVRQFLLLLVGGGLCFLVWKTADFSLAITETILILGVFGAFAFIKINNRPFHYFIIDLINFYKKPRLRLWHKNYSLKYVKPPKEKEIQDKMIYMPKVLSPRKLSELSLVVDTGGVYKDDNEIK
ncbi:MAG: PrgI family protein [Patescibacteria group bacterium]|jgi:hypothetical protein|nr:PrgI family protein [Patescibacteria group bacterium]